MNLKTMLLDEFNYFGTPTNEKQINSWADELKDLNVFDVKLALSALRKDPERTRPALPGKIRDQIYNYPSAEEAWAMCPKNEIESVVWTDEISKAFDAARRLIAGNDMIAARMVFKEVYEREVGQAKADKKKPKWWPTYGEDKDGRATALLSAVDKNRLTNNQALSYMPELALPEPGRKVLQLTTKLSQNEIDERQREVNLRRINELKEMLNKKQDRFKTGGES